MAGPNTSDGDRETPRESEALMSSYDGDRGKNVPDIDDEGDDQQLYTDSIDLETAASQRTQPPKRRRRFQYLTCGTVWGMVILATILLIDLLLSLSRSLWSLEAGPDAIFGNWGKPGTGTEGMAWYPTDFMRDIIPVRCHSHNDYWRTVPLFTALRAGCIGTEADVWLFDNDPKLYVGHETAALQPNRTFESLYVDPIVKLLEGTNPSTGFYNGSGNGVFDTDPGQTLILLVDVKSNGEKTWPVVLSQLEPLRARGWLSFVENGVANIRQVTVVGSGEAKFDSFQNATYQDAFFDAPLDKMWEDPDGPDSTDPLTYTAANSFYASTSFRETVGDVTTKLSDEQFRTIRGHVKGAHKRGLKARYWELPGWPIGLRNYIWDILMEEGVDLLNVDDVSSAAHRQW